jgi:hypothetical protein
VRQHCSVSLFLLGTLVLQACGGTSLSGGMAPQSKKKQEPANADGDQTVSDPQVVTGAYLACEVSSKESSGDKTAVGCSIMANNRKIIAAAPSRVDFFSVYQDANKKPDKERTATGYQSLFMTPHFALPQTQFAAQIFKDSSMVHEVRCDGSKLPCKIPLAPQDLLLIKADGRWSADTTFSTASKQAFRPQCPNNPDLYCSKDGVLYSDAPSRRADQDTTSNCLEDWQSGLGSIIQGTMGFDPKLLFDRKAESITAYELKSGESCVVPKRIRTGTPLILLNEGQGCYMFMVNKNGQAHNVIIKKSKLADPKTLSQQLAAFECKY